MLLHNMSQRRIIFLCVGGTELGELTYDTSSFKPDTEVKVASYELVGNGGEVLELGGHRLQELRDGFCNVTFKVGRTYRITARSPPPSRARKYVTRPRVKHRLFFPYSAAPDLNKNRISGTETTVPTYHTPPLSHLLTPQNPI